MNALAIKTAVRYVAGLATVIFFIVLLTVIFSFLGAFFCAALGGMMLGSIKLPRWQIGALSLTFPGVLFTVLRAGGTELLTQQILLLSALCLGTFWLTYLVVRAVIWYERKGQPASTAPTVALATFREACDWPGQQNHNAQNQAASTVVPGRGRDQLNLQVLQGKWLCAAAGSNSHREQKLMEIDRDKLVLTISDSNGKISFLGKGEVALGNSHAVRLLTAAGLGRQQTVDDTLVSI